MHPRKSERSSREKGAKERKEIEREGDSRVYIYRVRARLRKRRTRLRVYTHVYMYILGYTPIHARSAKNRVHAVGIEGKERSAYIYARACVHALSAKGSLYSTHAYVMMMMMMVVHEGTFGLFEVSSRAK